MSAPLLLFALLAAQAERSRVAFVELELRGPLAQAVLTVEGAGTTRLEGALGAGESLRLLAPVPAPAAGPASPPRAATEAGSVAILGERPLEGHLPRLPSALRARPLPAAGEGSLRAPLSALWVLAAGLAVALALRARPRLAWAAGLALATAAFALVRARASEPARAVEVLDGVAGSELWRRARAARGELELADRGASWQLAAEPTGAALELVLPLDRGRPLAVRAGGARLVAVSAESWPLDALEREGNALFALSECWVREDGRWSARGRWPLGAPLPPEPGPGQLPGHRPGQHPSQRPGTSAAAPPGWLASGLPQGVALVLGREERAGGDGAWVRCAWP